MEVIGLTIGAAGFVAGALGLVGTIVFGLRSRNVSDAFTRYVELEAEVKRLGTEASRSVERVRQLERIKADIYRHKYQPKSKAFKPGDIVRLVRVPQQRAWISEHSKPGMTGVIVDYGPGTYEYTVYWSEADYEGEPMDDVPNRWQAYFVTQDDIERIG